MAQGPAGFLDMLGVSVSTAAFSLPEGSEFMKLILGDMYKFRYFCAGCGVERHILESIAKPRNQFTSFKVYGPGFESLDDEHERSRKFRPCDKCRETQVIKIKTGDLAYFDYMPINFQTYGEGATAVQIDNLSVYFSFKRPIAFRKTGEPAVVEYHAHYGAKTEAHLKNFFTNQQVETREPEQFKEDLSAAFDGTILDLSKKILERRMGIDREKINASRR